VFLRTLKGMIREYHKSIYANLRGEEKSAGNNDGKFASIVRGLWGMGGQDSGAKKKGR